MFNRKLFVGLQNDYDAVEMELKSMLSIDRTDTPNPSLLSLSHDDLALLADQYRVRLLKGPQSMPLTNADGHEEDPLPVTDVDNE